MYGIGSCANIITSGTDATFPYLFANATFFSLSTRSGVI